MSTKKTLSVDLSQPTTSDSFFPRPPILESYQSGWKNIQFGQYQLPAWEMPEIANLQHTIGLSSCKGIGATEIFVGKRVYSVPHFEDRNFVGIFPANLPMKCRWDEESELTHCYLDSQFLNHAAYESVNPDRVELILTPPPRLDRLIWQIGTSLKSLLENDPQHSCFYAESMATALAAHLLQFYTTRLHVLREYDDGLSQVKLSQAIEYINEHLSQNLTLTEIAMELEMSQYYFSRLFKQSIGMTPHQYLIQQRVERSKQLLQQPEKKMIDIAAQCGFANPSHFARCFRQKTGISPKQFRSM